MVDVSSPFGSQARTRVLLAVRLLEESYPRELPLNSVQMAIRSLERDGLLASRRVGRTRLVRLNPRYFARDDLQPYLLTLAAADADLRRRMTALRRRPRRSGKPW
jgi:DNA-binding transcriptional ArsR family regulator